MADTKGFWAELKSLVFTVIIIALVVAAMKNLVTLTRDAVAGRKMYLYPFCLLCWLVLGVPCALLAGAAAISLVALVTSPLYIPYVAAVDLFGQGKVVAGLLAILVGLIVDLAIVGYLCEAYKKHQG